MIEEIKKTEIKKLNQYGEIFGILFILTTISLVPLVAWLGVYAWIPWGVLYGITMYLAIKLEKLKKDNHICTYKEIVAFTEGKRLL